ncbi:hypothetical protein BDV12DRAFT_193267 [Aspergillus spectabilis]
MRWTDEKENLLWKTIFNTHAFHIDLDVVAKAWPEEEKPTPKALRGHLTKWRKAGDSKITLGMRTKKSGGGGVERAAGTGTPTATPRKRGPNKKTAAKEKEEVTDQDQGERGEKSTPIKKEEAYTETGCYDEDEDLMETPSGKRVKGLREEAWPKDEDVEMEAPTPKNVEVKKEEEDDVFA